jgi:hypothetical protein
MADADLVFEVDESDWSRTRFVEEKLPELAAGQVAAERAGSGLPGPAPALFFAPAQIAKRTRDWGAQGFSVGERD